VGRVTGSQGYPPNNIHYYFEYTPNRAACYFFIIAFGVLCVALAVELRDNWLLHALTALAAIESGGYVARLILEYHPGDAAFKAELIILILAPNFLAFTCYVLLGKMMRHTFADETESNWIARNPLVFSIFYVMSDVLCLVVQSIGGAMLATHTTKKQLDSGKSVEVAGLALQLFFAGTFLFVCLYAWLLIRQREAARKTLTPSFICVGLLMLLLVIRNIYRTIEFSTGGFTSGYFQRNETWYIVFDPTLMTIALAVAALFNFPKHLPPECLDPKKEKKKANSKVEGL
jgi:hypothetical protein